ncbi:MAG: ATP synthase A1 subunit C [Methanobacteriota archaeon]|nr:MAG: ATP synthase A1 subunit C [Euryarchaeota archaeon]
MTDFKQAFEKLRSALPIETGNYPYVCARVKAKKRLLLAREMYMRYLQMGITEIARSIGEGQYAEELVILGTKYRGVDLIEMATRNNLAKVFTQIFEFSEGNLRTMISRYLDRYDVKNIKSLLRGRFCEATNEEIWETIIPAGSFTTEYLQKLLELETIDKIVDGLEGTIYWESLKQVDEEVKESGSLAPFEDALSHRYYSFLLEAVPPTTEPNLRFRRFIGREIDILNLKTLLRVRFEEAELERDVFIAGGLEIPKADLNDMIETPMNQLEAELKGTTYASVLLPVLKDIEQKGLNEAVRVLEKFILMWASKHSHIHPLSILPVLDYFARKEREVENIRIIARGKHEGLSTDVIKELLVI